MFLTYVTFIHLYIGIFFGLTYFTMLNQIRYYTIPCIAYGICVLNIRIYY